jgi:hypothetical protein
MRNIGWLAILALVLAMGCGKDSSTPSPVYTSVDGVWTFTTPDQAITVEFELKTTSGTLGIIANSIKVGGVTGLAAGTLNGVSLPAIGEIRVNANDAALVQPYFISFTVCQVSSNYVTISSADVSYSYPWGTVKTLTDVVITRK